MKIKHIILTLILIASGLSAEVKTDLKKFISSECNTVIGVDMNSILSIPEVNEFMKDKNNEGMKKISEMGLKPEDIESVIIGLNSAQFSAGPAALEKQPEMISISYVKDGVTVDKLIKLASENEVETKVEQLDGVKAVALKKDGKEFVMAELAARTIAVGSRKMVQQAIALKSSESGSLAENESLSSLADGQKGLFWVVGEQPEPEQADENAPLDNPMAGVFGDLQMYTLSIGTTDKSMVIHSDLICKDAAGANKLAMTAQLMTGMLAANQNSPVRADQIKFTTDDETVSLNIEIDKSVLMKTVKAAQGLAE